MRLSPGLGRPQNTIEAMSTQLLQLSRRRTIATCRLSLLAICTSVVASLSNCAYGQAKGEIQIDLIDSMNEQKLPCRVQLRGPNGVPIKPRSIEQVQGWNLVDGILAFRGKPGDYRYEVYHGPEFAPARGQFTLDKNSEAIDGIKLPRHADLASEGWFGGDLLSFRPLQSTQRWLAAEGLLLASSLSPLIPKAGKENSMQTTNQGDHRPSVTFSGLVDDRPESGLTFHNWTSSEKLSGDMPSSRCLILAKQTAVQDGQLPVHVEIHKLWARDLPIWLASGRIDSVQLLSQHLTYDGSRVAKVAPLVIPEGNYRGERGPGRMVEQIYWKILDAGLRIPPSAGSGFGQTPSPLGYNRVYALVGSKNEHSWWSAIRRGNSFVSNGPLLRVAINGMPPGHVFQLERSMELDIGVALTTSDPVEYLEVIFNGSSIYKAALNEYAKQGGNIPPLEIKQSGWLLVRVVTTRDHSYRLACTAPFYFELNGQNRIDAEAVKFFKDWLQKARQEIQQLSPAEQSQHEPFLQSAERFWEAR